jgi:RNA polymerase sigma factor for flagellar operon FliA
VTRAQALGESSGLAVVGFDDLPESQSQALCDESAATPQEQVERRMDRIALERAVALLPEREASIVAWHYFDGVPFKTIAVRLSVSEPRVSQLHARAMVRLRSTLSDSNGRVAA